MALGLEGKNVVITGGRGGLGEAVVDAFVAAGAFCHVPDRGDAGEERTGVDVVTGVDLANEAHVRMFYAHLPPLWASVHLAGGYARGFLLETSIEALLSQLETNLITAFLCCREAVRGLRGGGRIVNVCSESALEPVAGAVAYVVAKAGVAALTRAVAEEVRGANILVNAVAPSIVDTPANRLAMPHSDAARWPQPPEVARAIVWLASPDNALTSGAVLPVYGSASGTRTAAARG